MRVRYWPDLGDGYERHHHGVPAYIDEIIDDDLVVVLFDPIAIKTPLKPMLMATTDSTRLAKRTHVKGGPRPRHTWKPML